MGPKKEQCNGVVHLVALGDFNAKIGRKESALEKSMAPFGYGDERNERGLLLVNFCEEYELKVSASFFRARNGRKWTWRSPDGNTLNCIDHILSCKHINFKDVRTGTIEFATDHRLLRGVLRVNSNALKYGRRQRTRTRRTCVRATLNPHLFLREIQINCPSRLSSSQSNGYTEICNYIERSAEVATEYQETVGYLSEVTLTLVRTRHNLKVSTVIDQLIYTETCKLLRKLIREDIRRHHYQVVERAIRDNSSLRKIKHMTSLGRRHLFQLRDEKGNICNTKGEITICVKQYYEQLYCSTVDVDFVPFKDEYRYCPPFLQGEVEEAIISMKKGTSPGQDQVTVEMLQLGLTHLLPLVTELYNRSLSSTTTPDGFADSITILLHKRNDLLELKNYRPISLLSVLYKALTKAICRRVENTLDAEQPPEQAGFRRGYSTIDHLHALNELIERSVEYKIPLFLAFIDYEKAFDTIEMNSFWTALQAQGVDSKLIELLRQIYCNARSSIKVGETKVPINICRGVRQGDTVSPKLFTATLEHVFRQLSWDEFGISINGKRLTNLRLADDVVLIANSEQELQSMIDDLDQQSLRCGLKISDSKTKIMANSSASITLRGKPVDNVESFVYLGQEVTIDHVFSKEIARRIRAGWVIFYRYKDFLTSKRVEMRFKRKLFIRCILPSMIYGSETWIQTKMYMQKLAVAQRRMERKMVGVCLKSKKTNEWLRGVTKLEDLIETAKVRKWKYAWKLANSNDNKWSQQIMEWCPYSQRTPGRPKARWRDMLQNTLGSRNWQRKARSMSKKDWMDLI